MHKKIKMDYSDIKRSTILILVTVGLSVEALAQLSVNQKLGLQTYFKERIKAVDEETHLVPSAKGGRLSIGNLQKTRNQIWAIWKETYLAHDSIPICTDVLPSTASYPVQYWELKRESPMPFFFLRKGESSAGVKNALFLNLHGSGPKEMEFKNTLAWTLRYQDAPSIYFIPQIPNVQRYRWWLQPVQYSWERLFRLAMLSEAIDPNKIYVMGISEGGYGSQRLGAFYADYLAGAGPMAGGEPLRNAPPLNYRNIAFSLETGENDDGFGRNKLTTEAKKAFDTLANTYPGSFVHKIVLQSGKGHGIDYTPTTPWLIQYTRQPHPKHMSFVLFPMDGRYRKGFYNVALNKPLPVHEGDEFDRVLFDIQYVGNDVYVTAKLMNREMSETKDATGMSFALFLDENYVDLNKKINVFVNGERFYSAKSALKTACLAESCAMFADPERLYPTKVDIDL